MTDVRCSVCVAHREYRTVLVHWLSDTASYWKAPAHSRQKPTPMPTCDHCGEHVSDQFARVFANESGQLYACPSCSANAGIAEVARERAYEA